MNVNFSGLDDNTTERKSREKRFRARHRRAVIRTIIAWNLIVLSMAIGGILVAVLSAKNAAIGYRLLGTFTGAAVTSIVAIMIIAMNTAESAIDAEIHEDISQEDNLSWTLWFAVVFVSLLAGPFGASEGILGNLPTVSGVYWVSLGSGIVMAVLSTVYLWLKSKKPIDQAIPVDISIRERNLIEGKDNSD